MRCSFSLYHDVAMEALHSRRTYDYRIQEAICESGDRDLFPELKIPRSTIRSWIHRGTTNVVSCDFAGGERAELIVEIERLRRRTALLGAVVGLLIAMLRVSKVRLDAYFHMPPRHATRIPISTIRVLCGTDTCTLPKNRAQTSYSPSAAESNVRRWLSRSSEQLINP